MQHDRGQGIGQEATAQLEAASIRRLLQEQQHLRLQEPEVPPNPKQQYSDRDQEKQYSPREQQSSLGTILAAALEQEQRKGWRQQEQGAASMPARDRPQQRSPHPQDPEGLLPPASATPPRRKSDQRKYGEHIVDRLNDIQGSLAEVDHIQKAILDYVSKIAFMKHDEVQRHVPVQRAPVQESQDTANVQSQSTSSADVLSQDMKSMFRTSRHELQKLQELVKTEASNIRELVIADCANVRQTFKRDIGVIKDDFTEMFLPLMSRAGHFDDGGVPRPDSTVEPMIDHALHGRKIKFHLINGRDREVQITEPMEAVPTKAKPSIHSGGADPGRSVWPELGSPFMAAVQPGEARGRSNPGWQPSVEATRSDIYRSVDSNTVITVGYSDTEGAPSPMSPQSERSVRFSKECEQEYEATPTSRSRPTSLKRSRSGRSLLDDENSPDNNSPSLPVSMARTETHSSKSAFASANKTEEEDTAELRRLFLRAESALERSKTKRSCQQRLMVSDFDTALDSFACIVVIINACYIGFTMDSTSEMYRNILLVDSVLSFFFVAELTCRLIVNGLVKHVCGPNKFLNLFDDIIILLDLAQLCLKIYDIIDHEKRTFSLLRMIRLVRLVRLVGVVKNPIFELPLMMCNSFLGGALTLFWAFLILLCIVYFSSLLFRESLGRSYDDDVRVLFHTVPRSMLTSFKCSFGDCSSDSDSLFETLWLAEGSAYLAVPGLSVFLFVMTVGAFNVISAFFVEQTLASAKQIQDQKKHNRLEDMELWSTNVALLTRMLARCCERNDIASEPLSSNADAINNMSVPCPILDKLCRDSSACKALEDLDIDPNDFAHLSSIFDPDNNGSIFVIELIDGLKRLRGDPRRSDIVTLDLMIRSSQNTLYEVRDAIFQLLEKRGKRKDATRITSEPGSSRQSSPHLVSNQHSPRSSPSSSDGEFYL